MEHSDINKIKVSKKTWKECNSRIKAVNKDFWSLLNAVISASQSKETAFLYHVGYKFGQYLIRNGKMTMMLSSDAKDKSYRDECYFCADKQENILLSQEFFKHIGNTQGHPLSIIIHNYIEVFKGQTSAYKSNHKSHEYEYPLNIIKEGELFGIWESINLMFNLNNLNISGWDAVAGKHCITTTLPTHTSGKFKDIIFKPEIFGDARTYLQGFINVANVILQDQPFTEIIIIPELYYVRNNNDSAEVKKCKTELREYIFKIGWAQESQNNNVAWDYDLIKRYGLEADIAYILPLIKHLVNIASCRAYAIKPISKQDGILFKTNEEIINIFNREPLDKGKVISDSYTPLFFHYERINPEMPWAFEMSHSPAFDILLPDMRLDKIKTSVQTIFRGNAINKLLAELETNTEVGFYILKGKANRNAKFIKDLMNNKLLNIIKDSFPSIHAINNSNFSPDFNGLILIEKKF